MVGELEFVVIVVAASDIAAAAVVVVVVVDADDVAISTTNGKIYAQTNKIMKYIVATE